MLPTSAIGHWYKSEPICDASSELMQGESFGAATECICKQVQLTCKVKLRMSSHMKRTDAPASSATVRAYSSI